MKHYCGGQILFRQEEDIFYCSKCGKIFDEESDAIKDNEEHYKETEEDDYEDK